MDPVTHIVAGALGGQALRKPLRRDTHLLVFCLLAAWLPDIDNFIGLFGPEFYLVHHRGITHSFLGGVLVAVLFVGLFKLVVPSFSFKRGAVLAYLFISLHIFLDLITSYGTQILAPFSNTRYALTSVFILDPLYTMTMIFFAYRSFRSVRMRKKYALLGVAWIFLYPALNFGIRVGLENYLETRLRREGMEFVSVDVSTDILTPLYWKAIVEQGDTYRIGGFNLFALRRPIEFMAFDRVGEEVFAEFGRTSSVFATYAWFFDYPVMRTEQADEETLLTLGDLRFATMVPFVRQLQDEQSLPFALTVVLDKNRKPIRYAYQRPGREPLVTQLE